jgi:hypothetical protein
MGRTRRSNEVSELRSPATARGGLARARDAIHIHLPSSTRSDGVRVTVYSLAGQHVVSNRPIPGFEAFSVGELETTHDPVAIPADEDAGAAFVCFDGATTLGGRGVYIRVASGDCGFRITVEGLQSFFLTRDSSQLFCGEPDAGQGELFLNALVGPALLVALALRGTFCLHASAVRMGRAAVVFCGESGAGKSTIARELALATDAGFCLLGDDAVPVTTGLGSVDVLARYPQLKLPPNEQPWASSPERLPLASVYLLEPAASATSSVRSKACGPVAAVSTLVAHTVAARLFDRELLASHLEFCARAAESVPVRILSFPRRLSVIPEVAEGLRQDLAAVLACDDVPA